MIKTVKKLAKKFIKKHSLFEPDHNSLKTAAQNIGYTIIEFNNIFNDKDIETIIQNLQISDEILKFRGFTYADSNYRLIFINEDLSNDEKVIVLAHELGHIVCEHMTSHSIIGKDVKDEHEANEFAHYLLKKNCMQKLKYSIIKRKKIFIAFAAMLFLVLLIVVVGSIVKKEQSYYGEFYITTTGSKYHQEECIHVKNNNNVERLTKEQFESGDYKPCGTCIPE